eukprot:4009717-Amphidinium_carterae.1
MPSATAANITESIRRMSADTYLDRTSGTHGGFTCPLLVVWNFNELCSWGTNGMKPVDECKRLVDDGCEMICKTILDKPVDQNSMLGNLGARAYRRVIIL